jgi:hypothetical protein
MMKHCKHILYLIITLGVLHSCEKAFMDGEANYDPKENFEYLWKQIDEKYSYFELKNIDWNEVYTVYEPQVTSDLSNEAFFNLMFEMLSTLRDGHVNLQSPFNISRYNISYDAPENINYRLLEDYYLEPGELNRYGVSENSYITGPLRTQIFPVNDKSIGYIYYGSFSKIVSDYDIDYTLNRMQHTDGLIIDVRNNGGGAPINIFQILKRLTREQRLIYVSKIKNGPGHEDFDEPESIYLEPGGNIKYTKPIVLLTNRNCYSATSFFAAAAKAFPNITQIGDTTGGGAGAPHGGQMPNGWYYRFSVTRSAYPSSEGLIDFEKGVAPEITVNMNPLDEDQGIDSIIEAAFDFLLNQ